MPTISKKVIDKGLEVVKDAKKGVESAQRATGGSQIKFAH
jgi:hypothetical protein